MYSPSVDYAGLMVSHGRVGRHLSLRNPRINFKCQVERVNNGMKLGEYMQRHIFDVLSIRDITFHLEEREDLRSRRVKLWERVDSGLGEVNAYCWPDPVADDMGGGGIYTTVTELLKIYGGILRSELLRPETVKEMFQPQLQNLTGLDKPDDLDLPYRNAIYNTLPRDVPVNFGLGGLINTAAVPGRRGSHTLTWSGFPNCYWVGQSSLAWVVL